MSGICIKGMEMPVCHFKTSESYNVHGFWMVYPDGKSKLNIVVGSDHWVCEAIPVPDHGDLIDRDPFVKFIKEHWDSSDQWFVDQLEARQTIIPADLPVMYYPQVPGITPTVISDTEEDG